MNERAPSLECELCWDTSPTPRRLALHLAADATLADALLAAARLWELDGAQWRNLRTGIWGREVSPGQRLRDGDRVEIYRPLPEDPRAARRARVEQARRVRRPAR